MPVKKITSLLERCEASGQRRTQVFEDFLDLTLATLEMLPIHAQSVAQTGKMADDPPEVAALWTRLRERYDPESRLNLPGWAKKKSTDTAGYFDLFAMAFNILVAHSYPIQEYAIDTGSKGSPDILGNVYEQYAYPSPKLGQYFTPWNIALLMAQLTIQDGEATVHARLKAAAQTCDDPLVQAGIVTSLIVPPEDSPEYFHNWILPTLAPHADPIMIHEPTVGSGVMLLAIASQFPQWAINWGLVRFTGQDIDNTCVKICRVNCILYGLDSTMIKTVYELSQAEIEATPPDAKPVIEEVHRPGVSGDHRRVRELVELRKSTYKQMEMF